MKPHQRLTDEQLLHMRLRVPATEPDEEIELLREEKKRLMQEIKHLRMQYQSQE